MSEKPPEAFVKFYATEYRGVPDAEGIEPIIAWFWQRLEKTWRAAQAEAYEDAAKIAEDDDFAHKLDNIDRDLGAAIAAAIREWAKEER